MKRSLPPLYNYLFTFDGELMTGSCLIKIHLMEVEPTLIEVSSWVLFLTQGKFLVASCRHVESRSSVSEEWILRL